MKACTTGWKEIPLDKVKFVIHTEEKYLDKYIRGSLIDSYAHVAESMIRHLIRAGVDVNSSNALNHLVSEPAFSEIVSPTSQKLVSRGLPRISTFEIKSVLQPNYYGVDSMSHLILPGRVS